ncbi:hypothetical protein [Streptomyces sp. TRM49041]|uniref:LppU/SCO3897 family protein n=1 Tax=Streptomyces sp. TRM49041 TaxID=2603216 RepID=UPI0011F08265|nr:hypothetical protein [Streptomyces sp. TRM49041]
MTTPQSPAQPASALPLPAEPSADPSPTAITVNIAIVLGLIVVVIVSALAFHVAQGLQRPPEVGDCVHMSLSPGDFEAEAKECSEGGPDLYRVAKVVEGTLDPKECADVGRTTLAREWGNTQAVLCMSLVE